MILGILGSLIGVFSAISAFVVIGGDPAYSSRLWAGGASLALAALAGVATIFITARPIAGSLTMLIGGMIGFVCINLFYINTFYGLAIPLWLIGTVLAWISARTPASETMRAES